MNEAKAWLWISKIFYKKKDESGYIRHRGCRLIGICSCIDHLYSSSKISLSICQSMNCKMIKAKHRIGRDAYGYLWKLNKEGDKKRIRFCKNKIKSLVKSV